MRVNPRMGILAADAETEPRWRHIPQEHAENTACGVGHAVRRELAERRHTGIDHEWIGDHEEAVFVRAADICAGTDVAHAMRLQPFRMRIQFVLLMGYRKLADWVCDGSDALLATACRTEVSNSDDTVRLNNQHSRGLTVGHAAHAVDFNRRPILSRQNVLALFRIPTASTNRAAELHEYQRSGFDDGEPFAVVQGYGKLFRRPAAADAEIVSAVHAAADRDLAVRVEGQGSMLPVHTFQQYRAFILRQKTGGHRLMHGLAVGIDVG